MIYSEDELKEFVSIIFNEINRLRDEGYIENLPKNIPLTIVYGNRFDKWKEELKLRRREQNLNSLGI